jgi:2-polyprenyl-3-methyl-5-hydroxy-6-metoxy-1,4-benzoquinol methylase
MDDRRKALDRMRRFQSLSYEAFRQTAKDAGLSPNERIGFPDEFREGREQNILNDVLAKLPRLRETGKHVVDIGPGCAPFAQSLVGHCVQQGHSLVLVDSPEMLEQLPNEPSIRKVPGYFPRECRDLVDELANSVDVILTYSVFHYVFEEHPWHDFVDTALLMLRPGGEMLIGDIPNISKRKRFFSSEAGVRFHQAFTQTNETPEVRHNCLEPGQIDDGVLIGLVMRYRAAGYDAYLLPQDESLPMANRREDVLIRRP